MRLISLRRVINAMLYSLGLTVLVNGPLFLGYLYGKTTRPSYSDGDFRDNCLKFVVDMVLFALVMIGVAIYTNQASRLPKDIEYSRDLPAKAEVEYHICRYTSLELKFVMPRNGLPHRPASSWVQPRGVGQSRRIG
ncbi:hypothetical protein [Bifidobacterium sp. ESL0790]|uniref:hypothetical protein n=1 Tax=Bifidobacterium sp. ESL0790 TaxID=2983233 RepID=UPI0023F674E2|nr:hypothetical protein [Bifidobacterium sp. ESL0790]WEV72219.1 hypothetical protein OZY47_07245 [Bifidobacterium sp. ESL0790]